MKRTALPNRTKPMARKTQLRNRGGSMFKLTPDDKAQWKWMYHFTEVLGQCDCECGHWGFRQRAHLLARSRGGRVLDNIALLLPMCHDEQEKDTERFCVRRRVDLYQKAAGHTAQWREEIKGG